MNFPWSLPSNPDGERSQWSGAQHLGAVRKHIVEGPGVLRLDVEGYVAQLRAHAGEDDREPQEVLAQLRRGEDLRDDGRWVELSCGTRVRMGDCPWSDRVQAAIESLQEDGGDDRCPVRVAERVLEHVMMLAEEPVTLSDLRASSVVELATAVLDRHERVEGLGVLDDYDEHAADDIEAEQARMVLALHRALGRGRLPPPHTPPRRETPKPRWPPQSLPPQVPLLIAPRVPVIESIPVWLTVPAKGRPATTEH